MVLHSVCWCCLVLLLFCDIDCAEHPFAASLFRKCWVFFAAAVYFVEDTFGI